MTDYRALCAELAQSLRHYEDTATDATLLDRARAALAQPEPVGPTFAEIMEFAEDFFTFRGNSHGESFFATDLTAKTDPAQALEAFARAVLQRWGRPTLTPVPLSERLPGPEDCDGEGRCYIWDWLSCDWKAIEALDKPLDGWSPTWWLPFHALPLP